MTGWDEHRGGGTGPFAPGRGASARCRGHADAGVVSGWAAGRVRRGDQPSARFARRRPNASASVVAHGQSAWSLSRIRRP